MADWFDARNILAVRLDNAGDVIMLGPALRAVKEHLPQARISLLASPAGATAAELLPWVDQVIVMRALWQALEDPLFEPGREWRMISELAGKDFDAALIFSSFSQTPQVPGYVCYLAGIPLRAGESKEFGGAVLSTCLTPAPDELHQVERNLRLVESLGFHARQRQLTVAISDAARAGARAHLIAAEIQPEEPYVVLHPGASAQARRYPAAQMGRVAQILNRQGIPAIFTGTPKERPQVAAALNEAPTAIDLVGSTSFAEFAALVEGAAVVICGNTLPLHLADAVGTPVVGLYSGTDLESQWQPRVTAHTLLRQPTPCAPCYLFDCPIGLPCLAIPPNDVAVAALALLEHRLNSHVVGH
ncbi:MAG: glycosyltransferase family 9 protein [Oscillochloris sp.]|nr:glycosyltransferase family 9 protein [Oscillochloris sp.]